MESGIKFKTEVLPPAVKFSTATITIVHYHLSSSPAPSDENLAVTHQAVETDQVKGIKMFDHIVIGDDNSVSPQREGRLK